MQGATGLVGRTVTLLYYCTLVYFTIHLSRMAPCSLYSALLLAGVLWALVKSSALQRKVCAIWDSSTYSTQQQLEVFFCFCNWSLNDLWEPPSPFTPCDLRCLISKMFIVTPHPYCTHVTCHYKKAMWRCIFFTLTFCFWDYEIAINPFLDYFLTELRFFNDSNWCC